MIQRHAAIPLILAMLPLCCLTPRRITEWDIRIEMDSMKAAMGGNPATVHLCRGKRLGQNGFCYVIGREGTILCHPQRFLEGGSYGGNRFVKAIREAGSGCIIQRLGGTIVTVYYLEMEGLGTLCCAVPAEEISGPTSCGEIE
ncbi:MAG: hypothetical protein JXA20_11155 [Spirochaetes bacterium]|nr:hypothetical protein [Spirochaetota bacterium]